MKREIERFLARSDDGEYEATIIVYQNFVEAASRNAPHAVIPGLKEARTPDGLACKFKDEDTFEIVNDPFHPGMIVRRVEAG